MKIPFFSQRKNLAATSVPSQSRPVPTAAEAVIDYHEQTKHHTYRFARSLGYLDWDNQPNPFRCFEGAPMIRLPLLPAADLPGYDQCLEGKGVSPQQIDLISISRLFRNALAISAWKRYQDAHWALRVNPSSGNLHPTEGYAILPDFTNLGFCGVYHYAPKEHALELRTKFAQKTFEKLTAEFPPGTFLAGFTSIYWREAWKYGERAYRYCQHDLGHAVAAFRISAAVLGWQFVLLDELSDAKIAALLGLDRAADFHEAEDEYPHCIGAVVSSGQPLQFDATISQEVITMVAGAEWSGHANRLSASHVEWNLIDAVTRSASKPPTEVKSLASGFSAPAPCPLRENVKAERIIQQRRSAVAMDGTTSISSEAFFRILARVMPATNRIPFDALVRSELSVTRVHLALFVHRVDGLEPGLYMLVRDTAKLELLKSATDPRFLWSRPPECPAHLPLYSLQKADVSRIAAGISCGQEIAGDGAFSLGMIAEFEEPIQQVGAWLYPRLFWETGVIGQVLYLEAEAADLRATGIGCFFDDPVHESLGLRDRQFQSLYHFTVGGAVDDPRLTTEEPYTTSLESRISNPDLP